MTAGVVLLAAGRSQRFGSDKRNALLPGVQHKAASVLFCTLNQIQSSHLPCFVVLHPGDHELAKKLDTMAVNWGMCPDASRGMGHSLAFGVRATQHWNGWLIALADMPWVKSQTYRMIATQLNGQNIVRPYLMKTDSKKCYGNPVAFSRPFAYQLMQCCGDEGARKMIQQSPQSLTGFEVSDCGICQDIDYPCDIKQ